MISRVIDGSRAIVYIYDGKTLGGRPVLLRNYQHGKADGDMLETGMTAFKVLGTTADLRIGSYGMGTLWVIEPALPLEGEEAK